MTRVSTRPHYLLPHLCLILLPTLNSSSCHSSFLIYLCFFYYICSKATLLINIVTPRPLDQHVVTLVHFDSHKSEDLSVLHNFVKSSQRLQKIKELLDDQVRNMLLRSTMEQTLSCMFPFSSSSYSGEWYTPPSTRSTITTCCQLMRSVVSSHMTPHRSVTT